MKQEMFKIFKRTEKSLNQHLTNLQNCKQLHNENGFRFHNRVMQLAEKAYPEESNDVVNRYAATQFVHGQRDETTKHHLRANRSTMNITAMLDYVQKSETADGECVVEMRARSFRIYGHAYI